VARLRSPLNNNSGEPEPLLLEVVPTLHPEAKKIKEKKIKKQGEKNKKDTEEKCFLGKYESI